MEKTFVTALWFAALVTAPFAASSAQAQDLLTTTQSWDGGDFHYPQGDAQVHSVIVPLEENKETAFHCHPVPTLGYILSGTVRVETASGKTDLLQQGESVVEVMRTVHRGIAIGGPAQILVFYAGATGVPNTVLPDADPDNEYCDQPAL